jgi:TolA-binding protein
MKRPPTRRGDTLDELLERLALDDGDGPALPIEPERANALVRRARERCAPGPALGGRLLRFPKLPLIGIGVVVATSAAAAALGGFPRLLGLAAKVEVPADVREGPAHENHRSAKKSARGPSDRREASPPAESSRPTDEGPESPRPQTSGRPASAERRESASSAQLEPPATEAQKTHRPTSMRPPVRERRSSAAVAHEVELGKVTAPDSAPAADLLGVANRARAERRFAAALDAYERVIASFPGTRQAQIARVSAGDLELERGDSRAAEQLFYKALRDSEVGAEALFGLSEAYRAEGRVVEERRALVLFGQRHPSNPLAAAARRRLSELGEAHAPR